MLSVFETQFLSLNAALVLGPKGTSRGTTCIEVPTGGSQTPDPELPCLQGACVHVRCFPRDNLYLPFPTEDKLLFVAYPVLTLWEQASCE